MVGWSIVRVRPSVLCRYIPALFIVPSLLLDGLVPDACAEPVAPASSPQRAAFAAASATSSASASSLAGRDYGAALSTLLDTLQASHAAPSSADWTALRTELLPRARQAATQQDPAAFARVLTDLAHRLRDTDGVTTYLPGSSAALPGWLERTPVLPVGLEGDGAKPGAVRLGDGRVFLVSVRAGSAAAACGVRPGDEVIEVTGTPVGEWLTARGALIGGPSPQARTADALRFLLRPGETLRLTLRDPGSGQQRKVEFTAPNLDLAQFQNCDCVRQLLRATNSDIAAATTPASSKMLDLRGDSVPVTAPSADAPPPPVVLVDARTTGAAEALAARLRGEGRVLLVGAEATRGGVAAAGAAFDTRTISLPDGGEFSFPVASARPVAVAATTATPVAGVMPDVRVPADLSYAAAWIAGRDPVREAAIAAAAAAAAKAAAPFQAASASAR